MTDEELKQFIVRQALIVAIILIIYITVVSITIQVRIAHIQTIICEQKATASCQK